MDAESAQSLACYKVAQYSKRLSVGVGAVVSLRFGITGRGDAGAPRSSRCPDRTCTLSGPVDYRTMSLATA